MAGGLYASWPGLKLWLRYLAPAPLVFALVFLLVSPVSKLVLPQPGGTVDANSPGVRINPEHPVVMILLDEFPVTSLLDSKGSSRRPALPQLRQAGRPVHLVPQRHRGVGTDPVGAAGVLSGRYPTSAQKDASPTAAQYPDNLFTLLGKSCPVEQFQIVTQLCPPTCARRPGLGPDRGRPEDDPARLGGSSSGSCGRATSTRTRPGPGSPPTPRPRPSRPSSPATRPS